MNKVIMRSPEGELKEVEAPSEELGNLMNRGWTWQKEAPQPEQGEPHEHSA